MASYGEVVIAVVLILSHQVLMKPTEVEKENKEVINLEKELESQKPTITKSSDNSEDKDDGEWGNAAKGIDVGNVIRDVLLTLRDHPEIVRKLIAGEERNLAEQVLSSEHDTGSNKDDIVLPVDLPPRDFQLPPPQLQQAPKKVVKKMGSYNEINKRQKEKPEETIDMTFPVEGGSFEAGDIINQDSNEMKLIKDIDDTEQLKEGGSNQITYPDLKRNEDSSKSEEASKSDESNASEELSKAEYWKTYKNYGNQRHKPRQHKSRHWMDHKDKNGDENSHEILSKAEFWKNHRANNEKQKNDKSKGDFWKNYGKQKDSGSNSEDKDNVDSPELGDTDSSDGSSKDKTASSRSSESKASDENELDLYKLTKEEKHRSVM
ncbi:uncharacterized protein LOC127739238 [Mytilus californianus]|uniref:uncharacterized protein LOC127739238 n=1 Tax=Mytilus californianus TaxID=6549 RepID=UPI0022483538|nr:uncharacterized protein LOC127739238 [Mytilus californianus]